MKVTTKPKSKITIQNVLDRYGDVIKNKCGIERFIPSKDGSIRISYAENYKNKRQL